MIVVLDSGPLGLVTNPRATAEAQACRAWLNTVLAANVRVVVPEIADYEIRRELLRAGKIRGLRRLDQLGAALHYAPLTTMALRLAADFWAQVRRQGQPTASNQVDPAT